MRVLCVDDDYSKTVKGKIIRSIVFKFLSMLNLLPKFGHDYTVKKVINYEFGIQGYVLEECSAKGPFGEITFFSERFIIL